MIPIALLVDDSCPLIHVLRYHWEDVHKQAPVTKDGRRMTDTIPNSFLDDFCDVCDRWEISGKLSIVPAPAGKGNIVNGIEGFPIEETHYWLDTVKRRLSSRFDFTPEGITHNLTVDLATGEMLPIGESDWSQTQTRESLTPYLIRQLELLKEAGFDANGFTSPWVFGIKSEPEYIAAMVEAQRRVYNRTNSWYFLHMKWDPPALHPWVAYQNGSTTLVSIPANVRDFWWRTIDDANADPQQIANELYECCITIADAGGWPVVLTHWQSLWSNGAVAQASSLTIGLQALDEFARLIAEDGRFEWTTCSELAVMTLERSYGPRC